MINVNFLQPNSNESWKNFSLFSFLKARVDAELLMQIKEDFYSEIILFSIVTPQTDARFDRRFALLISPMLDHSNLVSGRGLY